MKDLREAKKILGMKITRDRDSDRLWLSQENYILKVLERFNMVEERSVTTPLAGHFKLLQAVSTITGKGGGDVSSTMC